jgi:hypothetical protein
MIDKIKEKLEKDIMFEFNRYNQERVVKEIKLRDYQFILLENKIKDIIKESFNLLEQEEQEKSTLTK